MKKLMVMIIALMAVCGYSSTDAAAQNDAKKATVQLTKEEKKQFKSYVDSVRFNKLIGAINDRHFLMQVDGVYFGGGPTEYGLSTATNFILLQNDGAIVQTAFNNGSLGFNGMGGFTCSGRVGDIDVEVDKKGNVHLRFHIMGSYGNADVQISIPHNSDNATAYVSPTFSSGQMTMYGEIIPFKDPSIHIDK
ncbi:MAG: DUF4251 domain-containing protein [Muribaculaceae bacterium]|nr:DUF4251 domain-containing protein [Muribaculaceae bacterium]